jgi:DUF438 domain-containing protein
MRTATMRQQHHEILTIAGEIARIIRMGKTVEEAALLRSSLNDFNGKFSRHLIAEESTIYSYLEQHGDARVRETARTFAAEMGVLLETVIRYTSKWQCREIEAHPLEFAQATWLILAALEARVDREDTELYPLLDRV